MFFTATILAQLVSGLAVLRDVSVSVAFEASRNVQIFSNPIRPPHHKYSRFIYQVAIQQTRQLYDPMYLALGGPDFKLKVNISLKIVN